MTKESKFKLEHIINKAVKEAYDIGFEDGRAFQGDLDTQGIGNIAESLVDIYKKEGREKARKPGRWKPCGILHKCSKCGMCFGTKTNFCPNCGADMRLMKESKEE